MTSLIPHCSLVLFCIVPPHSCPFAVGAVLPFDAFVFISNSSVVIFLSGTVLLVCPVMSNAVGCGLSDLSCLSKTLTCCANGAYLNSF